MSTARFTRWQKVTKLAPIAALSAVTTIAATGFGSAPSTSTAAADATRERPSTDAIVVPDAATEAPASASLADAGAADRAAIVDASSTSGIPAVALGAYQRAASIINGADASCGISWQLVAAVARVESDHGRYGGSQLSETGVATPGIVGIPLDGSNGTARILDTDAGELDSDTTFDRAVGPLQFIPSTWRIVGVDADADGVRDPQNINDAALAAAVYLCSGGETLADEAGKRAAVYRYNNSEAYVDLVLAIEQAYLAGDFTSFTASPAPTGSARPDADRPRPPAAPADAGSTDTAAGGRDGTGATQPDADTPADGPRPGTPSPTPEPATPQPEPTQPEPTEPEPEPTQPEPTEPTEPTDPEPTDPEPTDPEPTEPTDPGTPEVGLIESAEQGATICATEVEALVAELAAEERDVILEACGAALVGTPVDEAPGVIPDTLDELRTWVGLER